MSQTGKICEPIVSYLLNKVYTSYVIFRDSAAGHSMVETKVKRSRTLEEGFSARLNMAMDHAGYPPMERGRVTRLAEDMNLSKMTISKWLSKDVVPHGSNLNNLAKLLLKKLGCFASVESMERWLLDGDEAFNPIVLFSHKGIDYTLFSEVFQTVDKVARELGIKLEKVPQNRLDLLYAMMVRQAARDRGQPLDLNLIRDFLTAPTPT
jgi:transcriptional regulator with XRE-family HTH domain